MREQVLSDPLLQLHRRCCATGLRALEQAFKDGRLNANTSLTDCRKIAFKGVQGVWGSNEGVVLFWVLHCAGSLRGSGVLYRCEDFPTRC